jgi:hypothetical protein
MILFLKAWACKKERKKESKKQSIEKSQFINLTMIEPDLEHTISPDLENTISFLLNLDVGLSEEDIRKICDAITDQADTMVMFGN